MNNRLNLLFSVLVSILLASCVPYRYIMTPHSFGKVVDITTDNPIAGAIIYYEGHPEVRTVTNTNGEFDLPQTEGSTVVPLGPVDAVPPRGVVIINKEGYEPYKTKEYWWIGNKQTTLKIRKLSNMEDAPDPKAVR